jgi:hypothetical protein
MKAVSCAALAEHNGGQRLQRAGSVLLRVGGSALIAIEAARAALAAGQLFDGNVIGRGDAAGVGPLSR